jgi:hypothetical protein
MKRIGLLVVVLAVAAPALFPVAHACGDKFLVVGRGAKFQRVYASVYPGKVLIFARPSTTQAAIREPQLHKALRQAGHSVSVIEDWKLLEQALRTVPVDVVLVDVGEAEKLQSIISSSPTNPDAVYVAFPSSQPTPKQFICKLKASDRSVRFLDEIENGMKARARRAKNASS